MKLVMIHLIKGIINIEPFRITARFNNNKIRTIDLEAKLREWSKTPDSKFKDLLDPDYFKSVRLNKELETIYWDNGIDLCPDVLYSLSKKAREMDAVIKQ